VVVSVVSPVRVITYNIRKGKGPNGRTAVEMTALGHALAGHKADLVLCQEVFHCARTGSSQSGNLADAMGLQGYYGANKFRGVGHHGNSVFTGLTVERFVNHDISTNRLERRGALYLRLKLEGSRKPLHVFNVHLGLNRWQRLTQLEHIARLIDEVAVDKEPVVLAGDFNDWRRELDAVIVSELGFTNALAKHRPDAVRTWHARRPVFALDRIYTRHLKVRRSGRLDGAPWPDLSDHLPLFADLRSA
jgi:endonuclease/exonuclease/phosphatase family metal-dependent hydrolase